MARARNGINSRVGKEDSAGCTVAAKRVWRRTTRIWNEGPHPREIAGTTLGLIGIGKYWTAEWRERHRRWAITVIAVHEHVEKGSPEGVQAVFAPSALNEVLQQSDYVVLAAPLIAATHGLIDAERFAAMKPEACLINVGRGPQVDETALVEALRTGRIAGAALDVFEREPLPADSPLWGVENLLITPHTAGLTDKLWDRHYKLFSDNLRRYLAGQPLRFVVDKQKGY